MTERPTRVLLVAAFAAGAALRFLRLGHQSLWKDEIGSVLVASGSFAQTLGRVADDVHPPLYFFLLKVWMAVAGKGDAAVRGLSVLFDLASIGLVAHLGQRLLGARAGTLAACVYAVALLPVYYAQETRSYALLTFLTLASMTLFVRWLRGGPTWVPVSAGVVNLALVYTHYFGAFVLAVQGSFLLALALSRRISAATSARGAIPLVAAGVGFLPWVPVLLAQVRSVVEEFWIPPVTGTTVAKTFLFLLSVTRPPWSAWPSLAPLVGAFLLAAGLLGLAFLFRPSLRESVRPDPAPAFAGSAHALLWTWLLLPIAVAAGLYLIEVHVFSYRNLIVCAPAVYLLAASGLLRLRRPALFVVFCAALIAPSAGNFVWYYGEAHKERWREVGDLVRADAGPEDRFLFHPFWIDKNLLHYQEIEVERRVREEAAPFAGVERIWLVLPVHYARDEERLHSLLLGSGFLQESRLAIDPRISVSVWSRGRPAPRTTPSPPREGGT